MTARRPSEKDTEASKDKASWLWFIQITLLLILIMLLTGLWAYLWTS